MSFCTFLPPFFFFFFKHWLYTWPVALWVAWDGHDVQQEYSFLKLIIQAYEQDNRDELLFLFCFCFWPKHI